MKCSDVESRLDDYVDGALPEEEAVVVEAHLERCAACQNTAAEIRALLKQASVLPREITPRRDLWQDIAHRIEAAPTDEETRPGAHRGSRARAALRLGVPLAAAAVVLVSVLLFPLEKEARVMQPPDAPLAADNGSVPLAAIESEYREARRGLVEALEARRASLTPETIAVLEENLQVIEDAVREIRDAIQSDPDNPRLMRLLMATHRKELDFLAAIVRLPDEA